MPSIETEGLTKRFGSLTAVDHLNFDVEAGEIFGLLGPNGAGKTTTIRMLASLISPSEGYARVSGHDVVKESLKVREIVGILTENPSLYDRLTAYENMEFFAEAYGITDRVERRDRIRELLELFDLWERRDDKAGNFSKGMKQKLAITRAIVHNPEILFLDEPTSGLDPKSSKDIRDLMEELSRRENQTILLSTHRLEDADRLCSRVMIIKDGGSVVVGSPEELRNKIAGTPLLEIRLRKADERIVRSVEALEQVSAVSLDADPGRMLISLDDVEAATPLVVRSVVEAGGMVLSVNVVEPSLEEAYLKLVGGDSE
ncbi:ABC transporter ATP-binding protein [Candidatus Bathyarchaeota archaeon]|nr:ABC transporter ATP-binding protein [Candidatus Bathyarchaeota archaeon]MBL7079746.1 ABC transporter ATP-binding protein [Candidatus Bathyarchaeota archaeon]